MWHKPFSDRGDTLWSETTQIPSGWSFINTLIVNLFLSDTEWRSHRIDFYQLALRHDWMISGWGEIVCGVPVEINLNASVVLFLLSPVMAF